MSIQLQNAAIVINDATAEEKNVQKGKVFYNNDGRHVGSARGMSLVRSYHIAMGLGTLTGTTPIDYRPGYVATVRSINGNSSVNLSSTSWNTGYFCPDSSSSSESGYILKSISIDHTISKNEYIILKLRAFNDTKRIYLGKTTNPPSGNFAILLNSDQRLVLSYTNGLLTEVSAVIRTSEYLSFSDIDINICIYKEE